MKKASPTPRSNSSKTTPAATRVTKPRAPRRKPAAAEPPGVPGPSDADIARRAYEIFLARDGEPGDAQADWLRAEEELKAELKLKAES